MSAPTAASTSTSTTTSKSAITSLLTEHFRHTPLTLIDEVINSVNDLVYRAVSAVELGLNSAPASSLGFSEETEAQGAARVEIETGVHQLETLLEAAVDRSFDKWEIYVLRNTFRVPEELVGFVELAHYKGLDLTPQPADSPTPTDIVLLRRRLQETRRLHNALVAESASNTALITKLRAVLTGHAAPDSTSTSTPNLSFLTQTPAAAPLNLTFNSASTTTSSQTPSSKTSDPQLDPQSQSQTPLSTHSQTLISQLPALRQLLATLKPRLETLKNAPTRHGGPEEEERREHVESETRRLLERQGVDVDTGEGGFVGSAAGLGKRLGAEEVGAIEGIVDILGAAGRGKDGGGDVDGRRSEGVDKGDGDGDGDVVMK